jgi:hypothetical protein
MKAKLIKDDDGYSLFIRHENSTNREFIASTSGMYVDYKLSKQNCDELFGVINIEKLADKYFSDKPENVSERIGFKVGFIAAMALNKDKVFTIEDMIRISEFVKIIAQSEPHITAKELVSSYVQSLQQPTEIDVVIEMETCSMNPLDLNCDEIIERPKLDSEGCLILKRVV